MNVGMVLYRLFISPLELTFEVIFATANRVTGQPGWAIVCLSIVMNLLVLPLYRRADALQEEERVREATMRPWVNHIKRTFTGDERFMMLQTYYRQNNYKPIDVFSGSIALLLEIPFFVAAYQFLSHLSILDNTSFGIIKDLGMPDGLLRIKEYHINLLPLLMTGINLSSAAVYMKGMPLKNKIQMTGMALIFLVLLYRSPAGLVFYWTLNNVFSLIKNTLCRLHYAGKTLRILSSLFSVFLISTAVIHPMATKKKEIALLVLAFLLACPAIYHYWTSKRARATETVKSEIRMYPDTKLFWLACTFLAILTGGLIPTAVISDSPTEFIQVMAYKSPLLYVESAFLLACGVFLIWFGIFYYFADSKTKRKLSSAVWTVAILAVVDYMFFGKDYGNLSPSMVYDVIPTFSARETVKNTAVLIVISVIVLLIKREYAHITHIIAVSMCLTVIGMTGFNLFQTTQKLKGEEERITESLNTAPKITLSKNDNNVIVMMLDRGLSVVFPYLLEEKPELRDQFAGFTFYPNTVSYGPATLIGSPGLYGGYEYIPQAMNRRNDEPLVKKHNEALRVLPLIFLNEDYDVTVSDLSLANYKWVPDLSIFDDHPEINTFLTAGRYSIDQQQDLITVENIRNRNIFCYSLFKISPVFLQPVLYSYGTYNMAEVRAENSNHGFSTNYVADGISRSSGVSIGFLEHYPVLKMLPSLTTIEKTSDKGHFLMMANETPHFPILLQEPEYIPANEVDNSEYDTMHAVRKSILGTETRFYNQRIAAHYEVNMATMIALGEWFDYLRENDVFDNTRIILVSDHGHSLDELWKDTYGEKISPVLPRFNALLLVKDFGSSEFQVDYTFMTNADVPTLATGELIEDPINPATGKIISSEAKNTEEGHMLYFCEGAEANSDYVFPPGTWYYVGDNIFEADSWQIVSDGLK